MKLLHSNIKLEKKKIYQLDAYKLTDNTLITTHTRIKNVFNQNENRIHNLW